MAAPGRATKNFYLGIDLGGTKIITAIVDRRGRILSRDYRETEVQDGPAAVVGQMMEAAADVIAEGGINSAGITGVGIAAPGPIDAHSGVVTAPPNLPGWKDVPLRQLIEDRLGLPTALENDANAAALAEHRFGAGRGTKHMLYVTASTGIGGGFILDGKLYAGATGSAAEIGHMTILPDGPLCGCGNQGCLEALASGTAIAREARELVHGGTRTLIAGLAHGDPDGISARLVAQAAAEGDAEAARILDHAMSYLGIGMANLVNLFNPELLVIGGGLTKMGERLFGPVRSIIDQRAFPANAHAVRVIPAELGDDVGVLGAAAVAMFSQH
jgi:glucokinase